MTEHREALDPALLCRLSTQVTLPAGLSEQARHGFFQQRLPFFTGAELDQLVDLSAGMNGAELMGMYREAALMAISQNSDQVKRYKW